jgi:hypothetical protein
LGDEEMTPKIIRVADFSKLPGARHRTDGDYSADEFYEDYIETPLKEIVASKKPKNLLLIDLDGTLGYASSFVSQLAVRTLEACSDKRKLKKVIKIKSDEDPSQREGFWNEIKQK